MFSCIIYLYSSPSATVVVNGTWSEHFFFFIANGIRQGCPLSPQLFAIVIEHLAQAIRFNPSINGIQTTSEHCISSLTRITSSYMSVNPTLVSPPYWPKLHRFGLLRNFKLNLNKMETLNISLPHKTLSTLQFSVSLATQNYYFTWVPLFQHVH